MRRGPPEEGVHAAAVAVGARARFPFAPGLAKIHDTVGLCREDAWAAHFVDEQSAGAEANIANNFGIEAQARLVGEEFVSWVDGGQFRAGAGGLAIGGGGDDEAVEVFD